MFIPGHTIPIRSMADLGVGKGFPVDLALGLVDAYEWSNASRGQLRVWHRALNNDLRVTPTGGEDSISNMHISKPRRELANVFLSRLGVYCQRMVELASKGKHVLYGRPAARLLLRRQETWRSY